MEASPKMNTSIVGMFQSGMLCRRQGEIRRKSNSRMMALRNDISKEIPVMDIHSVCPQESRRRIER
ncbi:MAG: hypothetical protein CME32_24055 [Gimesia sp.]|nr:hypothetical protein [Gimesia sp.]